MQGKKLETNQKQPTKKRWFVRWWAFVLWVLLTLILILCLVGLWAWTQRYELLENQAVKFLAESGFDVELEIASITRTKAKIKDIRLSREGAEVLKIEDINADYIWPDVREGKFKRIEIDLSLIHI